MSEKRALEKGDVDLERIRQRVREWMELPVEELYEQGYDEFEIDTLQNAATMILTTDMEDWVLSLEEMRSWHWEPVEDE